MAKKRPTLEEYLTDADYYYDDSGQTIFKKFKNDRIVNFADIRGWSNLQKLFTDSDGSTDWNAACDLQDDIGKFVVDAIKEKIERDFKK